MYRAGFMQFLQSHGFSLPKAMYLSGMKDSCQYETLIIKTLTYAKYDRTGIHGISEIYNEYMSFLPDEYKYSFTILAYGFGIEREYGEISKYITPELLKYGHPVLPNVLQDVDVITVYRSGYEPIERAPNHISWSLSCEVAVLYAALHPKDKRHIYRGKIRKPDIIGYFGIDDSYEIMQRDSIFDVVDITDFAIDKYWTDEMQEFVDNLTYGSFLINIPEYYAPFECRTRSISQ